VVNLKFTPVADTGIRHLSDINGLKELSLTMTKVTDSRIRSVQSFHAIESMSYGSYIVTGLAGKSIRRVSKIKRLVRMLVWLRSQMLIWPSSLSYRESRSAPLLVDEDSKSVPRFRLAIWKMRIGSLDVRVYHVISWA
jgi:hypothetical protein